MSAAAALVVHDLKNELGALEAGLSQLALQPEAAAAAAAHRQCQRLRQRLVMYLTLYGGGELRAHCDDEAPADLIAGLASRHGARVQVQVQVRDNADAPPFWYYDRRLVTMALDAALHNALRHARSRVALGLRAEGGQLVFSVDDDGPGLDPANPAGEHSTGLGTALCDAVAKAHGGTVRLFNRENGAEGGARFELRLPT
jgi:signal transduction histidine kinase